MRCSNSILTVLSLCTLLLLLVKLIPFEIFAAHPAVKEIGLTLAQIQQRHPVLPVGEKTTEDAATASNSNNNLDIIGKVAITLISSMPVEVQLVAGTPKCHPEIRTPCIIRSQDTSSCPNITPEIMTDQDSFPMCPHLGFPL